MHQREHARYALQSPTEVKITYSDSQRPCCNGQVRNISQSGIFVETKSALEEYTYVNAFVNDIERDDRICFQGQVVRVSEHGMAIVFTYTEKRLKTFIEDKAESKKA